MSPFKHRHVQAKTCRFDAVDVNQPNGNALSPDIMEQVCGNEIELIRPQLDVIYFIDTILLTENGSQAPTSLAQEPTRTPKNTSSRSSVTGY